MARHKNVGYIGRSTIVGAGVGAMVLGVANALVPVEGTTRVRQGVAGLLTGAILGAVGGITYATLTKGHRAMNPATTAGAIGMGMTAGTAAILGDHIKRKAA